MSNNALSRFPRPPLHVILWVLQWVLGFSLVTAGVLKLALPFEEAVQMFPWAADIGALFPVTSVLDLLGGLGILVPSLTRIAPRVTVAAAAGVFALMLSAVIFYLLRGEPSEIVVNLVLAAIAAVIVWGRGWASPLTGALRAPVPWEGALPAAHPPAGMAIFQLPTGDYSTRGAFAIRGGSFVEQRSFTATAILVRHPSGDVLIDAGFGAHATEHIGMLPSFRRAPHHLGVTASDQLEAAGYDRRRLRGVVLTHSHWDHVSGLDSLDVPVLLTADERGYANRATDDRVFAAVSAGHEIQEYAFDGPAYLGFPASHDFHGDGSVVLVPAAGHTTGSVIAFVTIPSGERYAFIGDLTWQLDGVTRRLERPLLMRMLADSDAKQVRVDLSRIVAVADRMQVVPSHDARAYAGIPVLAPSALEEQNR